MSGIGPRAPVDACEIDEERIHLRSLRRALTSGAAILGVAPLTHALAPAFVPWLIAALSAIWAAMICTLTAVGIQELLLWRSRQRAAPRARRPRIRILLLGAAIALISCALTARTWASASHRRLPSVARSSTRRI